MKTPYEFWHGYKPGLTHLRTWGCRVLYHDKSDDRLESTVSDKHYEVLSKGSQHLKLVMKPGFWEREGGHISEHHKERLGLPVQMPIPAKSLPTNEPQTDLRPTNGATNDGMACKPVRLSAVIDEPHGPMEQSNPPDMLRQGLMGPKKGSQRAWSDAQRVFANYLSELLRV